MQIEPFELERFQSEWENTVRFNLSESGIHPLSLSEILSPEELDEIIQRPQGYGWTNGEPQLRARIAERYAGTGPDRSGSGGAGPDDVLVTNGSAEAAFLALWTLLEEGDEIVLMMPNYFQGWGIARSLGAVVKPFRLRPENEWAPDIEELRAAVGPRTKVIAICNPNNPTGAVLSAEEMRAIVEIAAEADAFLFVDEIYRGAEMDGVERPSFHGFYERTIVTGGLSKAYALPGLRIGWMVGPRGLIDAAWLRSDYTTITTALVSELVAAKVLESERRDKILARNRAVLNQNRTALEHWIEGRGGQVTMVRPRAGGLAFLGYSHDIGSTELANRLRVNKSVLAVPGDVFGIDGHLRIGIGERPEALEEALALLGEGLDEVG